MYSYLKAWAEFELSKIHFNLDIINFQTMTTMQIVNLMIHKKIY